MKKILPLLALLAGVMNSNGQIFQKTYGDSLRQEGLSVCQTSDQGFVFTGITAFTPGHSGIALVKTNGNGDTLWTRKFGNTGNCMSQCVEQASDGGYVICGYADSFGVGKNDIFLIKTNPEGEQEWSKTIGGSQNDYGRTIKQTNNGYVVVGSTSSFEAGGDSRLKLIRLGISGDTIWTRSYGNGSGITFGDGRDVIQTPDNGFIVAGDVSGFGAGFSDFYLIKTDSNGSVIWSKTYGGTGNDFCRGVNLSPDGGFFLTGSTGSFNNSASRFYIVRTNNNGDTLWTKTFGNSGGSIYSTCATLTPDTGLVMAGYSTGLGSLENYSYVVKIDQNGNFVWSKTYGNTSSQAFSIITTSDEGLMICGRKKSASLVTTDTYLIRTGGLGNSGCHEVDQPSLASTPHTLVSSPSTQSWLGSATTSPTFSTGYARGDINTFCSSDIETAPIELDFAIIPNPSIGEVLLRLPDSNVDVNVNIYNANGSRITSTVIRLGDSPVLHLKLIPGFYLVEALIGGSKSLTRKLVVQ